MWGFFPPTILYRKAGTSGCYNPNHGTRLSWGAGLNSARLEQAPSRYNSKLGYNSNFSVFGIREGG